MAGLTLFAILTLRTFVTLSMTHPRQSRGHFFSQYTICVLRSESFSQSAFFLTLEWFLTRKIISPNSKLFPGHDRHIRTWTCHSNCPAQAQILPRLPDPNFWNVDFFAALFLFCNYHKGAIKKSMLPSIFWDSKAEEMVDWLQLAGL